jgi:tetratricopeptide (TPR) repeat protein
MFVDRKGGKLKDNEILIASRELKDSSTEGDQSRRLAGNVFNRFVRLFTPLRAQDTQCGFKLYPAAVAKQLFGALKVKGWAHDVELLYRARLEGIHVTEMPIHWFQEPGSKISMARDAVNMLAQVLQVMILLKWQFYFAQPIQSLFNPKDISWRKKDGHPFFRLPYFLTLLLLLVFMPCVSGDYGITGDEDVQHAYGEHLYQYFATGGADDTAQDCCPDLGANAPQNLHYYGGFFDLLASTVYHSLGFSGSPYHTRHVLNALFGFLAILFTAKLTRRMGGYGAGLLAILLLALTPRFFGHAMNNPKDIPFAAAFIMTVYFLFRTIRMFPRPTFMALLGLTLGIAWSISIRIGGLMLIGFMGLLGLWEVFGNPALRKHFKRDLKKYLKLLLVVGIGGYLLGLVFWPYAHLDPIGNPLKALGLMEQFDVGVRLLFDGDYIMSTQVPWYYEPRFMLITLPLAIFAGFALLPLALLRSRYNKRHLLMLLFVMVFPLAYAIYQSSPLYDGMRHFLFIVPPMAVLAALSWKSLIEWVRRKYAKLAVVAVIAALLFLPLRWMVANHPHTTNYYNEVYGPTAKSVGQYDVDYWFNSLEPAVNWLVENENLQGREDTVKIVHNVSYIVNHLMERHGVPAETPWARYNNEMQWIRGNTNFRFTDWDYAIFTPRFMDVEELTNDWPPHGTLHAEKVDGAVAAVILKRASKADARGYEAMQNSDFEGAVQHFEEYLQADPESPVVHFQIGRAYYQLGDYGNATKHLQRSLDLRNTPLQPQQYMMLAQAYLQNRQPDQTLSVVEPRINTQVNEFNEISSSGALNDYQRLMQQYRSKAQAGTPQDDPEMQALRDDLQKLQGQVQRYVEIAQNLDNLYTIAGLAYQEKGDRERSQQFMQQAQQYRRIHQQGG